MSRLAKLLDPFSEVRVFLPHVSWQQYETLIAIVVGRPRLCMTFKAFLHALRQQESH